MCYIIPAWIFMIHFYVIDACVHMLFNMCVLAWVIFYLEPMWQFHSHNEFKREFIFVSFKSISTNSPQKIDMPMNICSHPYVDVS